MESSSVGQRREITIQGRERERERERVVVVVVVGKSKVSERRRNLVNIGEQ